MPKFEEMQKKWPRSADDEQYQIVMYRNLPTIVQDRIDNLLAMRFDELPFTSPVLLEVRVWKAELTVILSMYGRKNLHRTSAILGVFDVEHAIVDVLHEKAMSLLGDLSWRVIERALQDTF